MLIRPVRRASGPPIGSSVTLVKKKRGRTLLRPLFREQHLKSFWLIAADSLHTAHCVQQRNHINTSPAGDMSPVVVTSGKNKRKKPKITQKPFVFRQLPDH